MDPKHKTAIQKFYHSLIRQTDLHVMVSSLYEKGVFAEHMIEPYNNRNISDTVHKRAFYLHLMRRGPNAFRHLIDTLWENGLWNLARDLDPEGEFHGRPLKANNDRSGNDEGSFISISTKKKEKGKCEAETKKISEARAPSPKPLPPPPLELPPQIDAPPFDVKKCTEPVVDEGNDIKMYDVRGEPRQRIMLIYTYMNFDNDIEAPRRGADRDSDNLKYLFHELGFRAVSFLDLNKEETMDSLRNLPSTLEGAKCVFVVVSSHGYDRHGSSDNDFRCSDGRLISLYDFIEHFSNKALPQLKGVPKVFIFQTCRGKKEQEWPHAPPHVRMPARDSGARPARAQRCERDGAPPPAQRARPPGRTYSDILIAHSTVPGFVSNRIPDEGSWYIQTLCRVFAEHAHQRHVEELLTLVDRRMEATYRLQTSSVDKWGFNSRLYLLPGLQQ
ncbi:caspase Dronc [Amyelois transitella]|uniref:caspase Dronc n=1 Tax=Amyelois transitella TaxID=680683 RepID=UPI00298F8759|nr:caspase Dronc [Amyelois transitella]XP_060810904.1 caspase Dronc [Amyelois transitella]